MTILETNTCWELLRDSDVGRLAVSIADHPDIFPINFIVDHGTVVFRTAEGTKLAGAVLGRAVAFEVDGYDPDAGDAWSIVIKGRAREIERRARRVMSGESTGEPWEDVRARVIQRLTER